MSEANINHPRPPGNTQRDAAFSDIFGSAPPPGRSQTLTSSVIPPQFGENQAPPPPVDRSLRHNSSSSSLRSQVQQHQPLQVTNNHDMHLSPSSSSPPPPLPPQHYSQQRQHSPQTPSSPSIASIASMEGSGNGPVLRPPTHGASQPPPRQISPRSLEYDQLHQQRTSPAPGGGPSPGPSPTASSHGVPSHHHHPPPPPPGPMRQPPSQGVHGQVPRDNYGRPLPGSLQPAFQHQQQSRGPPPQHHHYPQPPPHHMYNQAPPSPNRQENSRSPRSLADWQPPAQHSNVPKLKTPVPPQQQQPPPSSNHRHVQPPYLPPPGTSGPAAAPTAPPPPGTQVLEKRPSNPNLRPQARAVSSPNTSTMNNLRHYHPQQQQHMPKDQQQQARAMSMTSASANAANSNNPPPPPPSSSSSSAAAARGSAFDREHRSHTMTLSGRVIPQRNNNEVLHLNQQEQQLHQQQHQSQHQNQHRSLPQSRTNSSSMLSSLKPSHSTRSASGDGNGKGMANGMAMTTGGSQNAQRSTSTSSRASDGSSYPHSTILTTSRRVPLVYPALLSKVADTFRSRIQLGDRIKNELTYKNSFTGAEAVEMITYIIKTPDRNLALLLGRALDAQKFFHDVTYDHRLRDTSSEVYQFNEIVVEEGGEQQQLQQQHLGMQQMQEMQEMDNSNDFENNGTKTSDNNNSTATVPVNGVFTLLAECYSPTCTRDQLCYSIACPRRLEQQARLNMKPQPGLKRAESRLSLHGDDEKEQKLWIHSVPKEIADNTSEQEKKRQEVICEVIYTERDFVKDLEYLRDFWIKPLRTSNIIPEARREKFIRDVFSRILEVHSVNIKLAEALTKRQQQAPVVKHIGDIFLEHVPKFDPFIRYGAHQLTGKYEFERERSQNQAFAKFVDETERLKESRKLELNGYLTKPTTRLARYPLLLEAVLKKTDEDNSDTKDIPEAIALVREFLTKVNIETGKAENRFNLFQLNQQLIWRSQHDYVDMKLTDESRQIIFKGFLKKRTQDKENQGDVLLYLFDHCLLFVRIKMANKREQLKVHRKPIPLDLLQIAESEEMPTKSLAKRPSALTSKMPSVKSESVGSNKYPLTFQYLGRKGYEITLYATTFITRKKWVEHIDGQQQVLAEKGDVFNVNVLKDRFFGQNNKVNCLAPLDGGRKLLYGTDNGIWLAEVRLSAKGKPTTSTPVKIITLSNITQIDVMEEYGMLLALSDKSLYSWPLDCLETPDPVTNSRRSKKVMGHVNFYKVGICLGRVLVCTVKSSSLTTTVKVMEPNEPQPKRQQKFSKLLKSPSEGLKVYKEFYIPSEALSISFLKRKLCVGCVKGFEIVDLKTLETQSLLDPADTSLDFVIRRDVLKPIAIYPLGRNFLLNYSDVSFFVNANGWRSRQDWKIEWEGVPQHFAFSYPYLIAFEPNFIEIRHVDTSELIRVITGENIRFLHESTREIIYVHEDVNGYDEVLSLDFWEKSQLKEKESDGAGGAAEGSATLTTTSTSTTLASVNEESVN